MMNEGIFKRIRATGAHAVVFDEVAPPAAVDGGQLAALALEGYPGLVALLSSTGDVIAAHSNLPAISTGEAAGRSIQEVLGLPEDDPPAGLLQLWLASVCGQDPSIWTLHRDDMPGGLLLADGVAMELDFGPVVREGTVMAVVMFGRIVERLGVTVDTAGAAPEAARAEPRLAYDPAQAAFLTEARGLLAECDAALARLAVDPQARHAIHQLFRNVHTLKGNARAVGAQVLHDAANAVEDELAELRAAPVPYSDDQRRRVHELVGELRSMVPEPARGPSSQGIARLHRVLEDFSRFHDAALQSLAWMRQVFETWSDRPRDSALLEALVEQAHVQQRAAREHRLQKLAARVEDLLALLAAAAATTRPPRSVLARIEQWLSDADADLRLYQALTVELSAIADPEPLLEQMAEAAAMLEPLPGSVVEELAQAAEQVGVLGLRQALRGELRAGRERAERLVRDVFSLLGGSARASSEALLARLGQVVREAGEAVGKPVVLEIQGEAPTLDEVRVRRLNEVLLHAVRNAIDHGLEAPEQRVEAGKPPQGRLTVRFDVRDGRLRLEVSDDGRGIDRTSVISRAVQAGLIEAGEGAYADELMVAELLFMPGFSTASPSSALSGRGVGMDAIRGAAEELGGSANLHSVSGRGTTLSIEIPL